MAGLQNVRLQVKYIVNYRFAEIMVSLDSGQPGTPYTKADIDIVWCNSRLLLLISYAKILINKIKLPALKCTFYLECT